VTGGRAKFFLCHAIYQYYAAIDWQVAAIDVLSTPDIDCVILEATDLSQEATRVEVAPDWLNSFQRLYVIVSFELE